jgi:hypothetical protein
MLYGSSTFERKLVCWPRGLPSLKPNKYNTEYKFVLCDTMDLWNKNIQKKIRKILVLEATIDDTKTILKSSN